MNCERLREFDAVIMRVMRSITASGRRRRMMQEELLAHLVSIYKEELDGGADEQAAVDAALLRFGNVDELHSQLQASVPLLERIVFSDQKENVMSRLIWLVGILAVLFGTALILPAMAKYKHQGSFADGSALYLAIGVLIALVGLGCVAFGVKRLVVRAS